MQALIVVDAQNEFSSRGLRAVPNHESALAAIRVHVEAARREHRPIAWVQHFNQPHEGPAFRQGSWGAELSPGLGPLPDVEREALFPKAVFGAFTGTGLEAWLAAQGARELLIVGFYAHMCVSTSVREALVRSFDVAVDPEATGARSLEHETLGRQSADEVCRAALLHLHHMGATVLAPRPVSAAGAVR